MKNIELFQSSKSVRTDNYSSDLSSESGIISNILENAATQSDCNADKKIDLESNSSVKRRSRFSLTFKRLSGPSKKKQKEVDEKIAKGGEADLPISLKSSLSKSKKNNKLKKGFLRGFRKPKEKNIIADNTLSPNNPLCKKSQLTKWHQNDNENSFGKTNVEETLASNQIAIDLHNQRPATHSRKIKITIKSKKIEPLGTVDKSTAIISAEDKDYLTPVKDKHFSWVEKGLCENTTKSKRKKVRSEKYNTTSSTLLTLTETCNENKCFITQSERDIPPNERAPQPHNVILVSRQTPKITKLISKPSDQIVATLSAPTNESGASQTSFTFVNREAELMQNPPDTSQRGHRFPRPTTSINGENSSDLKRNSAAPTTIEEAVNEQNNTTFVLQSHNSQIPWLPTPILKSNEQPPSHPPPPIPCDITSMLETRSTTHHLTTAKTASELGAYLHEAEDLVTNVSASSSEEIVSSAESAKPAEYFENFAIAQYSTFRPINADQRTVIDSPIVNFVVGSAVCLQTEFTDAIWKPTSIDSNKSSDSQSPISESSRRRIRYVAQPTLREDLSSLQRRRETLRYQAGISDCSLDSDDSVENQMPAFGDLTMDQEMEPTIMTSPNIEKREHLYKILVIGELGTGKTSFIKRYVHQFFSQNYRATIGVDFALKVLHWDANTIVRLQLWDIAGQERFGNMTRVYYKEAVGAFIVFDVTRSGTFDCVSKWKEDLDSKVQLPDGSPIPCILLANKCDQEKQGVVASKEKMDEYVLENNFAGWFETSAKENINIDEAARALVNKILLNDKLISSADFMDNEKFNLNNTTEEKLPKEKNKCFC